MGVIDIVRTLRRWAAGIASWNPESGRLEVEGGPEICLHRIGPGRPVIEIKQDDLSLIFWGITVLTPEGHIKGSSVQYTHGDRKTWAAGEEIYSLDLIKTLMSLHPKDNKAQMDWIADRELWQPPSVP